MSILRRLSCPLAGGLLAGCATVASAKQAFPIDEQGIVSTQDVTRSGLRISGEELTSLSSPSFGAIEVTFENTSAEWIRIQRVQMDFGGADMNRQVFVPWGEDIRAWYEATLQRNQIAATNRAIALGVVGVAGMVMARSGTSKTSRGVGGLASLAALTALDAERVSNAIDAAERVPIFPEHHLLSLPFAIPPNLFAKRWVLLNTPVRSGAPCIRQFVLTYVLESRSYERVFLRFKTPSDWQAVACRGALESSRDTEGSM